MSSFRVRAVRTTIAVGLGLLAVGVAERPLRANEALLQPTPLVLKDGRIANVSIHIVPFARGRADLAGQAEARVADLTRSVATDCFLTAQVIGHIESSEIAQDATLDAHRLARARADAVQASLIGGGLPAKSIASVWDWQFMVRAPRVTLWIFQLTAGEDCEGTPLNGALVAQATPSNSATASQPERTATQAEQTASAATRAPVASAGRSAGAAEPPAEHAKSEAPARAAAPRSTPAPPTQAQPSSPAKPAEQETAVAARPALAPKAPTSDGNAKQPAQPSAPATATTAGKPASAAEAPARASKDDAPATPRANETAVAAKPAAAERAPASDGKVERAAEGGLVITFATNSSWFPSGTSRRLRQLIAGLEPGSTYEVSLKVAVSASTKVVGARTPEEAARYNKWLAERRLERVQDWLREHATGATLTFKPEYVTDESRQVIVELAPVG